MSGWLLISTVAAAAILGHLSAASFTGFPSNILNLERAFPANQPVELEYLRARDRVRHSRMLQNVGGVANFYVAGESDPYRVGLYFSKIKLGSPPQVFNVQIDTGSDILWVNCNSCTDCPRSTDIKQIELNFFDAASSSTASMVACSHPMCTSALQTTATQCSTQTNQCSYSFQYGDGSGTSGFYVSDTLYFDKILGDSVIANSSAPIFFGCSTYQSGDLTKTDRAIDGIFGFGQQDLSVVSQLASQGITPKVFSHCLKGEGNGGGILVLGEILDPGITYTPLVSSQAHYNLNLQSISVSGQILQIDPTAFITSDNRGTIIDSGTTLAYLVEEAYDPLLSAITSTVSQTATPVVSKGNQCYLVSTSITEIFPLVTLNFDGGASMVLKPEEYLVNPDSVDGAAMWCFGFQKAQDQAITILGDLVLKDKIFVYDIARQRVGWTDYDCSQTVNVSASFGKDEYVNAGQIRMSSASRTRLFNKLLPTSTGFFLIHNVFFTGFFLLIS